MNKERNLAIIPARSGSKGLLDKNIEMLNGKPLMAYTIKAALECGMFSDIIVSTDSERYADIAREHGATVPFLRSAENSTDAADSWSVVREVLDKLSELGKSYDTFTLLQPTSPLRTASHIEKAFELYHAKNAKSVISVCICEHSPLFCNSICSDLSLNGFISAENLKRRQDMPDFYRINGAIYLVSTIFFASAATPFNPYNEGTFAYIMSADVSLDIDTELDFLVAESYISLKNKTIYKENEFR